MRFSSKRLLIAGLALGLVLAGGQAYAQAQRQAPAARGAAPAAQAPAAQAPAAQAPAAGQPAAAADQQPPAGPVRVDLQAVQGDWTKVCGNDPATKKQICYTTRDFGQNQTDTSPVLAVAVYDVQGDDQRVVRLLMPPGLLLQPGFRFSIDKGAELEGAFQICFPNGCFAESKVKAPTLDALKKGTIMNVSVKNQANNTVTFGVPLSGFGKAFDGAPIDPQVLQQQQQQLEMELQKRAEDERARLQAQQPAPVQFANPIGSPAPAAAPAAAPAK